MTDAIAELERGREAYASQAWMDAYESLSRVDRATPLGAEDLELLATCAYMIGREARTCSRLPRTSRATS